MSDGAKYFEEALKIAGFLVGRDRIELSTQGFSVLCSTD
jgi:hypothetical protein